MQIVKKKPLGRPRKTENTPLTQKQEKFVKELVANDGMITKRQAAMNAGYPEKSAHVKASEMTNPRLNPHICARIKEYRAERDEKYGITFARHVRDLQKIRDVAMENGAYSAAVQAEYRRGQAQGNIYINKSEIRHGSIDSMSRDEVMKALEEIQNQYGNSIINITPIEKESGSQLLQEAENESEEISA